MDELEFRKRVYANPGNIETELLNAARANPAYQKILDETVAFEDSLGALVQSTEMPAGLAERLLAIAEGDAPQADTGAEISSNVRPIRANKPSLFQYYAVAASLILAVGVIFSLSSNSGPSSADIVFGDDLLEHLHQDSAEIDDITGGENYAVLGLEEVNSTMANAGTRLVSFDESRDFAVRSAKPCEILPAYESAHLVLAGNRGAISIIVINNSPVEVQYRIGDERFEGIVLPMEQGNMILVGEKNEDLSQYASLFAENVEWAI